MRDTGPTRWQLGQGCDVWPPKKGQKRGDRQAREDILGVTGGGEAAAWRLPPPAPFLRNPDSKGEEGPLLGGVFISLPFGS